jgi:ribosomal protein S18 acetylase RimI-like enzyme
MSLAARVEKLWDLLTRRGVTGVVAAIREHGRPRRYCVYRRDLSGAIPDLRLVSDIRWGSLWDLEQWRTRQQSVPAPFRGDRTGGWADFCWAWSGGQPVGIAWTTTCSPLLLTDPGEGVIVDLYTRPECRGRGVATALIERACRQLKDRDCHAVYATVELQNMPSRRAFERSGFIQIGEFTLHGWLRRRPRTARWAGLARA